MAKDNKDTQELSVIEAAADKERVSNIEMMNAAQVHPSRTQFTKLMLTNPNYFGTMPKTGYKPVQEMSGNTYYEELRCIGLNPEQNRLEAVFDIKRQSGYDGNACGAGSTEYVRFFVERSGVWHDLGDVSLTVYDMPGSDLPLSYSVAIDINELRRICRNQNLVQVRGILSWNLEPTASDASFVPPWGNVLDVTVQIAPYYIYYLKDALAEKLITIEPELLASVNLEQKLETAAPQNPSFAQLKQMYANTEVPPHRYGFSEAQKALKQPLTSAMLAQSVAASGKAAKETTNAAVAQSAMFTSITAAEIAEILKLIEAESGNTTYEQLSCAGYNPQTNEISGVISIKRSSGFSGGLCGPGSTEYVGFWVYFNHAWQWLGNAQVKVHDLHGIDEQHQVEYAAFRTVNMPSHPCMNLAGLPLRAILSWNTPPTSPNYVPTWGNVINTHVQPPIGEAVGDDIQLNLESIGAVLIRDIADSGASTGRAFVTGTYTCNLIGDRPFGGRVDIAGFFTNAPNIFDPDSGHIVGGAHPLLYQVSYHKVGDPGLPVPLNNNFTTEVTTAHGEQPGSLDPYFQQPIISGAQPGITGPYYTWMGGSAQAVHNDLLAQWYTYGLANGPYEITVQGYRWNGASYVAVPVNHMTKTIYVYNGIPTPALEISSGSGDCGDVTVGDTLQGTFSVTTTEFFGYLQINVPVVTKNHIPQPVNPVILTAGVNAQPNPVHFGDTTEASTNGMSGTWSLSTVGMTPCGYNIHMDAYDRTIMNSDPCVWANGNSTNVGFCLRVVGGGGC